MLMITAISEVHTATGRQSVMTVRAISGAHWDIPVDAHTFDQLRGLMSDPRHHQPPVTAPQRPAPREFPPSPQQSSFGGQLQYSEQPQVIIPEPEEETFGPMSTADRFREMVEQQSKKSQDAEPRDQGEQIPVRGGLGGLQGVGQL